MALSSEQQIAVTGCTILLGLSDIGRERPITYADYMEAYVALVTLMHAMMWVSKPLAERQAEEKIVMEGTPSKDVIVDAVKL